MNLKVTMQDVLAFSIDYVRRELEQQGHRLTGALEESLETATLKRIESEGWVGEVEWLSYGGILNTGTKASRIPYTPGSGAKTSKYITGLYNFVVLRNIKPAGKEALGVAFAIARKQLIEGMPTKGSYKFTQTGKRTKALDIGLTRAGTDQKGAIEEGVGEEIENVLSGIFSELSSTFPEIYS